MTRSLIPPDGISPHSAGGLVARLAYPVDIASLAVFRMFFGLVLAWLAVDYLVVGRVQALYVRPAFHFTYYGFDWVQPLPGAAMVLSFASMALLGLAVAAGFLYRSSSLLLALNFTYFFLLDRTNYQNHYYLLMLLAWTMAIVPAHRLWSFDAAERPSLRSDTYPAWALWLVRFHVGLPYLFGGVAKIDADWFAGAPLRQMLASQSRLPLIGPLLTHEPVVQVFIWGGLLFDLLIVPLLLWQRTRLMAYGFCLAFHLTNSMIFDSIHVFPWFMILATPIFFSPDWPRRMFRRQPTTAMNNPNVPAGTGSSIRMRVGTVVLLSYVAFHVLWPLRHFAEGGQAGWTERGHHFAWRMMLRGKTCGFRYFMFDPATGETWSPNVRKLINPDQEIRFVRDPEMILHLAHRLAEDEKQRIGRDVEVRALVLVSLNGRKPQLLIDPLVDLAREPRGYHPRPWIIPLEEPLPNEPWTVPVAEWPNRVPLPPLPYLNAMSGSSGTSGSTALSTNRRDPS